jgi:hypothetical protein
VDVPKCEDVVSTEGCVVQSSENQCENDAGCGNLSHLPDDVTIGVFLEEEMNDRERHTEKQQANKVGEKAVLHECFSCEDFLRASFYTRSDQSAQRVKLGRSLVLS